MPERSSSPILTVDREGVAWITFADPDRKMNILDQGVMERLAAHLQQREVGFALLVGKDPEVGDLVGKAVGLVLAVTMTGTHQDDQALANLAHCAALDRNSPALHSLDHRSHRLEHSLRCQMSSAILAPVF